MLEIKGSLIVDLHPAGTVRMVFIAILGGGHEAPVIAKNLDAAEVVFMTCGLTPERAATLSAKLERNKVASVRASIDNAIAANFCSAKP